MHYSCTGIGSDVLYLINGSVANNFVEKGFIQQNGQDILSMSDDLKRRNLTLTSATTNLNNTNVQCCISTPSNPSGSALSNISTLKIQGKSTISGGN